MLADAKAVDELKASGQDTRPLCGLPFAVKDNIDVVGYPTVAGTPALHGTQISQYQYLDSMMSIEHAQPISHIRGFVHLSCDAQHAAIHVQQLQYACMHSIPHNIFLQSELSCQACKHVSATIWKTCQLNPYSLATLNKCDTYSHLIQASRMYSLDACMLHCVQISTADRWPKQETNLR